MKLLVILFIIKTYASLDIFKYIEKKHGQEIRQKIKTLEKLLIKATKVQCDIDFIKSCKKENLIPNFSEVKIAIKSANNKLQLRIARMILETELQNKHYERKKLKTKIRDLNRNLRTVLGDIWFVAILHKLRVVTKSCHRAVKTRHGKKLTNLRNQKPNSKNKNYLKHTVKNLSSYTLTEDEEIALSFGLDYHIPNKPQQIQVEAEFEKFFQTFLKRMQHIPDEDMFQMKTKLLNSCQQYCNIKTPYKHQKVVNNLKRNNTIIVMKQDKGRGVVIIDRNKYTEKCLAIINSNQFLKCKKDETSTVERKIQNVVRKIKNCFTENDYRKVYPSGSAPGKFYGTAKLHKMDPANDNVNDLPIRPIVSNLGTASYQLAKYLAKLLIPLGKSEYTVNSSKEFIAEFKSQPKPNGYKLISFDVKALFTNVPLDFTINLILRRIYDGKELTTTIPKESMKEMLLLCTKNVIFSYNNDLYKQTDGVAMGSPLGPVLANIFMVELERSLLPTLADVMLPWRRYVDDTITWIKTDSVTLVLNKLNDFHENIDFTYELENENKTIAFLDVLIMYHNDIIDTTIYRKSTNTDIFLHWDSFAPNKWKTCTVRTLIMRAYQICSTPELRRKEIDHLHNVFTKINGYPTGVVNKIMEEVKAKHENDQPNNTMINTEQNENQNDDLLLVLPYQGKTGEKIVKSLKNTLNNIITAPKLKTVYTGTKLSSKFNIKDRTQIKHQNDVIYKIKCPEENCNATYIGETVRRLHERLKDHQGRDKNSNVIKHTITHGHKEISIDDITILAENNKTYYNRKILESLFIKKYKPSINSQQNSIPLKLFI